MRAVLNTHRNAVKGVVGHRRSRRLLNAGVLCYHLCNQLLKVMPTPAHFEAAASPPALRNEPIVPSRGVITLFGYGIRVQVERGHLVVEDGIGQDRRQARFARVRHGLRRLIVVGSDGMVSLSALRWLADQDAAFVMLDRDGSVLATTGPVRPSDARLRRAQALAHHSGVALQIIRQLISKKLEGQEKLASNGLRNTAAAQAISNFREGIATAPSMEAVRFLEARAGHAYWSAWRALPVCFPKNDLVRVPDHWRTFGTRVSPLTGSPRLAVSPPNALLNFLYAVLESETRLAVAALGLDPGLGIMHADSPARDSLACDVMEPIRPQVDAYVLKWISRETLRREWFFEQRNGNCRLMGPFAAQLSETARTWSHAIAPIAEWVSRALWSTMRKPSQEHRAPTRLTQSHRRQRKACHRSCLQALRPALRAFARIAARKSGRAGATARLAPSS